ncbi:Holliday junction branch migration protein RuvA [Aliidiomarina quisquiliarum]|uniref:Holliday junction branch migration protein RuvA n=1 Tax=Aliidiomarina quisquiliarum TaxID=2938947 RepID=UPI00208F1125|nr:Holliday junction branch migration protein RuvA [Aliidiomarina quisquiliarum]MCO4322443.1 Holliday junction branch migration protein RuvA [Aliidiomarina quisquiliarum]
MIGRLQGILAVKHPPELLIDVQGVGYEVQMPMTCFYELPDVGQQVTVWIHFVVREDAQLLFGFNTVDERALFRLLLRAQGVGPKLALTIMSSMSGGQFVAAIQNKDIVMLTKIPGVGKKTADRLVVELKDRLKDFTGADYNTGLPGTEAGQGLMAPTPSAKSEALSALVALGYKPNQAEQVMRKVATDDMSAEDIIRQALKAMM